MTMKICFCVRNDFFDKFGGDTLQVEKYAEYSGSKYDVSIKTLTEFKKTQGNCDVCVLVNSDRTYEFLEFYKLLKNFGIKYFVLPIHHSLVYMDEFYRDKMDFPLSYISKISDFYLIEKIKMLYFLMRDSSGLEKAVSCVFSNLKKKVKSVLVESEGWICLASGEYDSLLHDYGIKGFDRYEIVRNGCDSPSTDPPLRIFERNIDVLVCGRIEPRKNQLAIAKMLNKRGFNVVFIGGENKNNKKYSREFKEVVSASDNLQYLGKVDPGEMYKFYGDSKIHVSASWFEVSSLVDLEAYVNGCMVITSVRGYSSEIIKGDSVKCIDPNNLNLLPDIIEDLLSRNVLAEPPDILPTWEQASAKLFHYIGSIVQDV